MHYAYVEYSTRACPAVIAGCLVILSHEHSDEDVCNGIAERRDVDAANVKVRTVTTVPLKLVPSLQTLLPTLREEQIVTTIGILSLMLKDTNSFFYS